MTVMGRRKVCVGLCKDLLESSISRAWCRRGRSSGPSFPFSGAGGYDTIYGALFYIVHLFSLAKDQVLILASQSLDNTDLDVHVVISLNIVVDLHPSFHTLPNLLVKLYAWRNCHTDFLIQALNLGCAPENILDYRNEEIGVDIGSASLEHGALLHPDHDEKSLSH